MLNNARTCADFKDDSDSWNEAICTSSEAIRKSNEAIHSSSEAIRKSNEAIHSSSEAIRTSNEARYTLLYRKQTNKGNNKTITITKQ